MPKNKISDILNNLTKSPGVYKFLDDSDNVYNSRENTIIQIYKFGFWILLGLNILQLAL